MCGFSATASSRTASSFDCRIPPTRKSATTPVEFAEYVPHCGTAAPYADEL
jgi:hypothetical protein